MKRNFFPSLCSLWFWRMLLLIVWLSSSVMSGQTKYDAQKLHETGRKYLTEGNIAEGRKYTLQAMDLRKQLFGEVSREYIASLNNYALSYTMEGNGGRKKCCYYR